MGYLDYELDSNEHLITIIRRHWAVLSLPFAKAVIGIIVIYVFSEKIFEIQYGSQLVLVWIITSISYMVYEVFVWYLNCFIITDKRIIDIDQKSMFKRVVAEVGIDNIQEAVYKIEGPLETVFNFGTVRVKTASSGSMIGMEQVPDPANVKNLIVNIQKNKKDSGKKITI